MVETPITIGSLSGFLADRIVIRGTVDGVPSRTLKDVLSGRVNFPAIETCRFEMYTAFRIASENNSIACLCSVDADYSEQSASSTKCTVNVHVARAVPFGSYEDILVDWRKRENEPEAHGWMDDTDVVITGCIGGRTIIVHRSYHPLFAVYESILVELKRLLPQNCDLDVMIRRFVRFIESCMQPYHQIAGMTNPVIRS